MALPAEFDLIARHFRPLAAGTPGALDLADDAALLVPPLAQTLVLAADAMVEGVHFLSDDPPEMIGQKLLRVNLSDLAAMGARPLAYLMTAALPRTIGAEWLAGFTAGLAADQARFGIDLLGGDTVSTPGPITLSLTIIGKAWPGRALRRSGARPGDDLYVSGTIGDGALGLLALTARLAEIGPAHTAFLADRYRLPQPRLALGIWLEDLATACMDVSDGLVQDAGHIARASGVSVEIAADAVPLSEAAAAAVAADPALLDRCLTGGDDYELLIAAPPGTQAHMRDTARGADVAVTRIGRFTERSDAPTVRVRRADGAEMPLATGGWSHFA